MKLKKGDKVSVLVKAQGFSAAVVYSDVEVIASTKIGLAIWTEEMDGWVQRFFPWSTIEMVGKVGE